MSTVPNQASDVLTNLIIQLLSGNVTSGPVSDINTAIFSPSETCSPGAARPANTLFY